jgi:hypothetical protein
VSIRLHAIAKSQNKTKKTEPGKVLPVNFKMVYPAVKVKIVIAKNQYGGKQNRKAKNAFINQLYVVP